MGVSGDLIQSTQRWKEGGNAAKHQCELAGFYIYIKELSNHHFLTSFPRRIFCLSFFF